MHSQFIRTELMLGRDKVQKLKNSKIAIFGVGGVGSFVAEGLARAGVSNFVLIDNDNIEITNLNRQIHALHSTIGKYKVDVMKERILDINPDANVTTYKSFYMPDNKEIDLKDVTYIVDAIDTITAKIELVMDAKALNIPIISSMGTGNKLDPTKFEIADISKTSVCPLAKVIRKELRNRGINNLKVLYSKEEPIKPDEDVLNDCLKDSTKRQVPASISFVPSVAGLIIAGEVIKDIIKE